MGLPPGQARPRSGNGAAGLACRRVPGMAAQRRRQHSIRMRRVRMELHRLRKEARLTCSEVARKLDASESTISRWESGQRGLKRDDLSALLAVYHAPRRLRDALLKLHGSADEPGLLDMADLTLPDTFRTWFGFEEDASEIWNYEPLLVPGLVQTFGYARAVIAGYGVPLSDEEIESRVNARIARQTLLRLPDAPALTVVLNEAALRQNVGGPDIMRGQLEHLVEAAERPSVTIRVVRLDAGAHPGLDTPFAVLHFAVLPSLVLLENKVASLYLEETAHLNAYRLAFKGILAAALDARRSVELLRDIAAGLSRGDEGARQ
ncbi:helix-turn-helix domain-containing protein [Solihabitans fulvus]|uniref:Helix-turn-helix domain-containing protein n=1 Tax=Solihabitans fulvus TaxID=1892852 RepID=A0A5B2XAJ8_9PSEU|nr:helix-turn-helix transcriptional regulator [Solihabitans fulvus]KAA2260091.1 helix-turn-helix domain-containing protein [Solihabitans fulvus]